MNISAVVVTKGDFPLGEIAPPIYKHFEQVLIWNNSQGLDLKVFGRYAGAYIAAYDHIYVQDDDCLVDPVELLKAYDGKQLVNYISPERKAHYAGAITLVGHGAIFPRKTLSVFRRYLQRFPLDDFFLTECDRIFTGLAGDRVTILRDPIHMPWARDPTRLSLRPQHDSLVVEVQKRLERL